MLFVFTTPALLAETGMAAPPEPIDETLFPRIASGDREALASLYRQTARAVYGFILSILKNRQEAEDVLQDAYLQISRCAGSYQPRGKPMAWLLTIAKNLSLMRLRQGGARVFPEEPELLERFPTEDFSGASEDRLMLEGALRLLSDQERQIVLLHALTGLKHREIAALLGLPLSTVLSKYSRSMTRLKRYWSEGGTR